MVSHGLGIVKIVLVSSSIYNELYDEAQSIIKSREEILVVNTSISIKPSNYTPTGYGISVFANPWIEYLYYAHVVDVKDYLFKYNYYFGTAEVYISSKSPSINLFYSSFLPELVMNFIADVGIISYIIFYSRET